MELVEQKEIRNDHPDFRVGDTLRVHFKIREGEKERVQIFEGVLIGERGGDHKRTITVRKMSFSQGVERIFPVSSPRIDKIEVVQSGHVRRAKLYYLRDLRGKKARIRERQDTKNGMTEATMSDRADAE
jgi:large subunit ribosomal protein L19